ncbi:MAG: hypothetical protein Q9P90_06200 [candidate division KSB1 bacterium]|nr:hypothetical protein [candidate division KSB1 bacterium]
MHVSGANASAAQITRLLQNQPTTDELKAQSRQPAAREPENELQAQSLPKEEGKGMKIDLLA